MAYERKGPGMEASRAGYYRPICELTVYTIAYKHSHGVHLIARTVVSLLLLFPSCTMTSRSIHSTLRSPCTIIILFFLESSFWLSFFKHSEYCIHFISCSIKKPSSPHILIHPSQSTSTCTKPPPTKHTH